MNPLKIRLDHTDLASINTAAEQLDEILKSVARGEIMVIDLSAVLSISGSYADELFGVLAAVTSLDWIHEHVQLVGARESVLRDIASSINRRLSYADRVA